MRNIEKVLKKKNITMYQLANGIDESHQRTNYIVKTKNFSDDYKLLKKIAEFLNCSIEDIID